jgi:hypothetical protein
MLSLFATSLINMQNFSENNLLDFIFSKGRATFFLDDNLKYVLSNSQLKKKEGKYVFSKL